MRIYPQFILWTYVLLPAICLLLSPTLILSIAKAQQQKAKLVANALNARAKTAAAIARNHAKIHQRRLAPNSHFANGMSQKHFKLRTRRDNMSKDMRKRKTHWDQQDESMGQLQNMWNMNSFGNIQNDAMLREAETNENGEIGVLHSFERSGKSKEKHGKKGNHNYYNSNIRHYSDRDRSSNDEFEILPVSQTFHKFKSAEELVGSPRIYSDKKPGETQSYQGPFFSRNVYDDFLGEDNPLSHGPAENQMMLPFEKLAVPDDQFFAEKVLPSANEIEHFENFRSIPFNEGIQAQRNNGEIVGPMEKSADPKPTKKQKKGKNKQGNYYYPQNYYNSYNSGGFYGRSSENTAPFETMPATAMLNKTISEQPAEQIQPKSVNSSSFYGQMNENQGTVGSRNQQIAEEMVRSGHGPTLMFNDFSELTNDKGGSSMNSKHDHEHDDLVGCELDDDIYGKKPSKELYNNFDPYSYYQRAVDEVSELNKKLAIEAKKLAPKFVTPLPPSSLLPHTSESEYNNKPELNKPVIQEFGSDENQDDSKEEYEVGAINLLSNKQLGPFEEKSASPEPNPHLHSHGYTHTHTHSHVHQKSFGKTKGLHSETYGQPNVAPVYLQPQGTFNKAEAHAKAESYSHGSVQNSFSQTNSHVNNPFEQANNLHSGKLINPQPNFGQSAALANAGTRVFNNGGSFVESGSQASAQAHAQTSSQSFNSGFAQSAAQASTQSSSGNRGGPQFFQVLGPSNFLNARSNEGQPRENEGFVMPHMDGIPVHDLFHEMESDLERFPRSRDHKSDLTRGLNLAAGIVHSSLNQNPLIFQKDQQDDKTQQINGFVTGVVDSSINGDKQLNQNEQNNEKELGNNLDQKDAIIDETDEINSLESARDATFQGISSITDIVNKGLRFKRKTFEENGQNMEEKGNFQDIKINSSKISDKSVTKQGPNDYSHTSDETGQSENEEKIIEIPKHNKKGLVGETTPVYIEESKGHDFLGVTINANPNFKFVETKPKSLIKEIREKSTKNSKSKNEFDDEMIEMINPDKMTTTEYITIEPWASNWDYENNREKFPHEMIPLTTTDRSKTRHDLEKKDDLRIIINPKDPSQKWYRDLENKKMSVDFTEEPSKRSDLNLTLKDQNQVHSGQVSNALFTGETNLGAAQPEISTISPDIFRLNEKKSNILGMTTGDLINKNIHHNSGGGILNNQNGMLELPFKGKILGPKQNDIHELTKFDKLAHEKIEDEATIQEEKLGVSNDLESSSDESNSKEDKNNGTMSQMPLEVTTLIESTKNISKLTPQQEKDIQFSIPDNSSSKIIPLNQTDDFNKQPAGPSSANINTEQPKVENTPLESNMFTTLKNVFNATESTFGSIEAEMSTLTDEEKDAFVKQELELIKAVLMETIKAEDLNLQNKTKEENEESATNEPVKGQIVASPNLFQVFDRDLNHEDYRRNSRSTAQQNEEFDAILGAHKEKLENIQNEATNDGDLLMISFIGNSVLKDLGDRRNKGTEAEHSILANGKNRKKRQILHRSYLPLTRLVSDPTTKIDVPKTLENVGSVVKHTFENPRAPMYHVRSLLGNTKNAIMSAAKVPPNNILIPSKYEIANLSGNNNDKENVGGINKKMIFSRSKLGTSGSIDTPKEGDAFGITDTFQKIGGIIKDSVNSGKNVVMHANDAGTDARAPMSRVRSLLGNTKNTIMSAAKVPPNNILIPSKYEIANLSGNNNDKENVGGINKKMIFLRSKLGTSGNIDSPKEGDAFRITDTFQQIGGIIKDGVNSGKNVVMHANEVATDARNVLYTAKHAAPHLLVSSQIPVIARSVTPSGNPGKKAVLKTPRLLDVQENIVGAEYSPQNEFIGMGQILDAVGFTRPDQPQAELERIVLEPSAVDVVKKWYMPKKLRSSNAVKTRMKDNLKKSKSKDIVGFLNGAEDSVRANNLKDFFSKMRQEMKQIVMSQHEERKKKRKYKVDKLNLKETYNTFRKDYKFAKKKPTRKTIVSIEDPIQKPDNLVGTTNSKSIDYDKIIDDNTEVTLPPDILEIINPDLSSSPQKVSLDLTLNNLPDDSYNKMSGLSTTEDNVNEAVTEETVGLYLIPELMKPFMGQPSDDVLHNFMRENGDEVSIERKNSDNSNKHTANEYEYPVLPLNMNITIPTYKPFNVSYLTPHPLLVGKILPWENDAKPSDLSKEISFGKNNQHLMKPSYKVVASKVLRAEKQNDQKKAIKTGLNIKQDEATSSGSLEINSNNSTGRTSMKIIDQYQKPFMGVVRHDRVHSYLNQYNNNLPENGENFEATAPDLDQDPVKDVVFSNEDDYNFIM